MKKLSFFYLISVLVFASDFVCADQLIEGEWQGYVTMHQQAVQLAKFKVRKHEFGETITMFYNDRPYQFDNLEVKSTELNFVLDTGSIYRCKLLPDQNDLLSGKCLLETVDEKRTILIEMQSPFSSQKAIESESKDQSNQLVDGEIQLNREMVAEKDLETEN